MQKCRSSERIIAPPADVFTNIVDQNPCLLSIARVMNDAQAKSVIRVFADMLRGIFVMDWLAHYGEIKTARVITQNNAKTVERLKEF